MANGKCLKPLVSNDIKLSLIKSINLVDPVYYDSWIGPYLAEDIKLALVRRQSNLFR